MRPPTSDFPFAVSLEHATLRISRALGCFRSAASDTSAVEKIRSSVQIFPTNLAARRASRLCWPIKLLLNRSLRSPGDALHTRDGNRNAGMRAKGFQSEAPCPGRRGDAGLHLAKRGPRRHGIAPQPCLEPRFEPRQCSQGATDRSRRSAYRARCRNPLHLQRAPLYLSLPVWTRMSCASCVKCVLDAQSCALPVEPTLLVYTDPLLYP
jgi:hypothetical protein